MTMGQSLAAAGFALAVVNCVKEGTKRIDCQLICLFQAVGEGCLPFLEREREEFFIESLVKKWADRWMSPASCLDNGQGVSRRRRGVSDSGRGSLAA
jgi:hypothetical protein